MQLHALVIQKVAPGMDTITIRATPSFMTQHEFSIIIYKTARKVKVVYSIIDSVRFKDMHADTAYINLNKKRLAIDHSKPDPYLKDLLPIFNKYKLFSRDSIELNSKKDTAYINLLSKVLATSNDVLENKEHIKRRGVLDGTSFVYQINSGTGARKVQAQSPGPGSYPLLYALVHDALEIYRVRNKRDIFKDKHTGYY